MKTVLFIDDEPEILELLEYYFKKLNFVVVAVTDPISVDAIARISPGIIVLDHNLNGEKSGGDICRELKADPRTKKIPVLMLSADENLPLLAKASCADAYLEKPFDIATLYKTMQEANRSEPL